MRANPHKRDEVFSPRYHSFWRIFIRPLVFLKRTALLTESVRPNLISVNAVLLEARGGAIFHTARRLTPTADSLPVFRTMNLFPVNAYVIYFSTRLLSNLTATASVRTKNNPPIPPKLIALPQATALISFLLWNNLYLFYTNFRVLSTTACHLFFLFLQK